MGREPAEPGHHELCHLAKKNSVGEVLHGQTTRGTVSLENHVATADCCCWQQENRHRSAQVSLLDAKPDIHAERTKVWIELWILAYNVASDTHEVVKHMITLEDTFDWYKTESNLRRVYMYINSVSIVNCEVW